MNDLIIIGAGDLGKDVAWLVDRINNNMQTWNLLGFTELSNEKSFQGYPILGNDEVINNYKNVYVVCAIANPHKRKKIIENLPSGINVATLIDPSVMIHKSSKIGDGSLIFANTLIGVDTNISKNCIVLYGAKVNHDCNVGEFTTIYPNATISGKCDVGNCCEIGSGSSTKQGITICDNSVIGIGAAVFTDVKNLGTTYGNPAMTMGIKK